MNFESSKKFADPQQALFAAGLKTGQVFLDLGSGSGFYSLAAAKIVGPDGMVYSTDILESALDHTASEARMKNLRNIKTIICDLETAQACAVVADGSVDVILGANIFHQVEKKANLFNETYRLLKTGGKLVVIEWNEVPSPIGPESQMRINQSEIQALAKKAGLKVAGNIDIDNYHYGLTFIK